MSIYTGSNNGFMQAAYVDQQGTALPGDLAYASDVDLIDACVVSMPAGSERNLLPVGVGVVGAYSADASRPGMTSVKVSPVGADTTAAQLYGVTVRNQQCRTDENNVSGWGDGDVCNVMRTARVGVVRRQWPERQYPDGRAVRGGGERARGLCRRRSGHHQRGRP